MWTRRSHFLLLRVRIRHLHIPFCVPLRIFWECIDALEDLMPIASRCAGKPGARKVLPRVMGAMGEITKLRKFDLVDVQKGEDVRIRIRLR